MIALAAAFVAQTPSPSPSATVIEAPPADPLTAAAAIIAIALAAGVLGYRIIRGGRGL